MKLSIWDTAGQEKFDSLTKLYFNNTEAALIVYDVTSELSFEKVKKWVQDLDSHEATSKTKIAKFIVGNKIDCNNIEVAAKQAIDYAQEIGAEFHEVSAKNDTNITPLFQDVCLQLSKIQSSIADPGPSGFSPGVDPSRKKSVIDPKNHTGRIKKKGCAC